MTDQTRRPPVAALSEINITPLIDVMLVLLIIFMVVTPVATKSLDASLPSSDQGKSTPAPQALVLEVGPDRLALNQTTLTGLDELAEKLRDTFLARSDKTLFVRAEASVRYADFVSALDVARGAGAQRIGIVGRPPAAEIPGAN
jgi:biopolymer transport protein ExbD